MIEYLGCTYVGKCHKKNEDRIMINNTIISEGFIKGNAEKRLLAIVCDGVGGCSGGDLAATIITNNFYEFINTNVSPATISRKLHCINRIINHTQRSNPTYKNMASTIAGLVICNNSFISFNLGDTRIYAYHHNKLECISDDHIIKESGLTTNSSSPNTITRYLGGQINTCYPSIKKGILFEDCLLFICSDGIYKHIPHNELEFFLAQKISLNEKKNNIINYSNQNGSLDDMSIVLIKCFNQK